MSSTTTNLGLLKKDPLADGNDTFNIKTMLNDNWDTIDAFAGQTTPIARGGTGATTADSARTNLGIPAAVQNILTTGGYSKIQVGSYVGTGTYGEANPCSLTFAGIPQMLVVAAGEGNQYGFSTIMFNPLKYVKNNYNQNGAFPVSWSENSAQWYASGNAADQFNVSGITYMWFAIVTQSL